MNLDSGYLASLLVSPFFLAFGFVFLMIVIATIDSAARNMPLPEFEVFFENKSKTLKLKRNEQTEMFVCVKNKGEEMGENVDVFIHFPPVFAIQNNPYYEIEKQPDVGSDFPNYNAVIFRSSFHHADIISGGKVFVTTPSENGTYEIPITVYESKTGQTKDKLKIEVTD